MSDGALSAVEYTSRYSAFMAPARRSAIAALGLPPGSHGFDAGCGSGDAWPLLLEALGPTGRITSIDIDETALDRAASRIAADDLGERVVASHGDLTRPLAFADGAFDWVWSADVLWPDLLGEGFATIRELRRVTRPGGQIALYFGNYNRGLLLPGEIFLESRLYLAQRLQFFGDAPVATERHTEWAQGWLRAAGLVEVTVTPHCFAYAAPLPAAARGYLEPTFARLSDPAIRPHALQAGMTDAEWLRWRELADPTSARYLLDRDDYYCVRYGLLTSGRVPL